MTLELPACREVREGLTEYLENALPSGKRQGFETHLAACAGCRHILQQLQATTQALSALPGEQMPAEMKQTLLQALRGRQSA
jgi:anti-sigma factor RsiW